MLASLLRRDLSIRLMGVAALLAGLSCIDLLFGGHAGPGATRAVAAGAGFMGCSGGAMLTCLGAHIHDHVRVARPWGAQLSSHWSPRGDAMFDERSQRRLPGELGTV